LTKCTLCHDLALLVKASYADSPDLLAEVCDDSPPEK
jgi:hypothetical protein